MATFTKSAFSDHDDWMTPKHAWEDIKAYLPKDKIIWEPFYGDGTSGRYLTELGCDVIHEDTDFFKEDKGDVVVSNPPFSLIPHILKRLTGLNKPFILIMPSSKINTQYFRNIFLHIQKPQIIIPKKRINFLKMVGGVVEDIKSSSNFDCFYYCWRMNLPNDIVWLSDHKERRPIIVREAKIRISDHDNQFDVSKPKERRPIIIRRPKYHHAVEIKESPVHGKGVFATQDIPPNTKLWDYQGEEMTLREFKERYGNDISRSYSMRRINKIINGKNHDNLSHWMNESRHPNAIFKKKGVWTDKAIVKGEELFLRYPPNYIRNYTLPE
jgi:hypothetical protein